MITNVLPPFYGSQCIMIIYPFGCKADGSNRQRMKNGDKT